MKQTTLTLSVLIAVGLFGTCSNAVAEQVQLAAPFVVGYPNRLSFAPAKCPAKWAPGDSLWYDRFPKDRVGAAVLGVYTNGGTVVTAGTTDWAHGLRGNDPAVVRITKNILDRLSKP